MAKCLTLVRWEVRLVSQMGCTIEHRSWANRTCRETSSFILFSGLIQDRCRTWERLGGAMDLRSGLTTLGRLSARQIYHVIKGSMRLFGRTAAWRILGHSWVTGSAQPKASILTDR